MVSRNLIILYVVTIVASEDPQKLFHEAFSEAEVGDQLPEPGLEIVLVGVWMGGFADRGAADAFVCVYAIGGSLSLPLI